MTQPAHIRLMSPAKINLFLHIIGKRADGYHNLQTVFRRLDWGDRIDFYTSNTTFRPHKALTDSNLPITLHSTIAITTELIDNLVTKAAIAFIEYLKEFSHLHGLVLPEYLPVIDIQLVKVLPTGAGLGGGSSNAASTLLALNQLWGFNLDQQVLITLGARVGADVPIFIFEQDALAEGIGEKLSPISLPHQYYLLLNPEAHASTHALFSHPDLIRNMPAFTYDEIKEQTDKYLNHLTEPFCNVFTPVVTALVPEVNEALGYLKRLEAVTGTTARMTGSGSSVFLPIPANKLDDIKSYITHVNIPPCDSIVTQSL